MKILVNAVHFTADDSLVAFVNKKLKKIETFYDKIISAEVFLKLDKGEKSAISKKLVEVKLYVPGNSMFVKDEGSSFEEAVDKTMEVLKRKVKRYKEKTNDIAHQKPAIEQLSFEDDEV
jgi:putative sigma-54 modulation protein